MALKRIKSPIEQIGTGADLNTYTNTGVWHQRSNSGALDGVNYPGPYAGLLEVFTPETGMTYQRYTAYSGRGFWTRGLYSGSWSDWQQITTA